MSPTATASEAAGRRAGRRTAWAPRWLVIVHRYLGVALGALMLLWCLSGMVMLFVHYPERRPRTSAWPACRASTGRTAAPSAAAAQAPRRCRAAAIEHLAGDAGAAPAAGRAATRPGDRPLHRPAGARASPEPTPWPSPQAWGRPACRHPRRPRPVDGERRVQPRPAVLARAPGRPGGHRHLRLAGRRRGDAAHDRAGARAELAGRGAALALPDPAAPGPQALDARWSSGPRWPGRS